MRPIFKTRHILIRLQIFCIRVVLRAVGAGPAGAAAAGPKFVPWFQVLNHSRARACTHTRCLNDSAEYLKGQGGPSLGAAVLYVAYNRIIEGAGSFTSYAIVEWTQWPWRTHLVSLLSSFNRPKRLLSSPRLH